MYTTKREQQRLRLQNHAKKPSFSSTLLDQIYRSIDEGNDMKLYNETMVKQQNRVVVEEEEITAASIRRACLLEKWKESEKAGSQRKTQTEGKSRWHHHHHHHHHNHEHDQEVMFFSSTSSSSDSSSGLLSSSDTESLYGVGSKSRVSCFAPSRPKPLVTSVSNEVGLIKSESRALKIYNNLKKVKQPISPGGKLSNFLNSLFATGGSVKKTKTYDDDAKASKSGQDSSCSSASSFSRSCLSKASTSSKDKLRDGVKRTVRFYPVSVIVGEDSRACGHKCLYEKNTRVMDVSVPTVWKIGRKKNQEVEESRVVDRSRRVEEVAREFLKEYHRSQKKSDFTNLDVEDDEDDAASCSSSDLFELDHLAVMGNDRYREELPVYETTYVSTNRAIANGLI